MFWAWGRAVGPQHLCVPQDGQRTIVLLAHTERAVVRCLHIWPSSSTSIVWSPARRQDEISTNSLLGAVMNAGPHQMFGPCSCQHGKKDLVLLEFNCKAHFERERTKKGMLKTTWLKY